MKDKHIHIGGLFVILLALAFVPFLMKKSENFTNLEPGTYPVSVDEPILYGDYPVKENPGVTNLGSEQLYKDYPIFPAKSDKINNIRYWDTPNNGQCSPGCMCGGLYDKKTIDIPAPPPVPQWGKGTRVNYYDSESFNCS
jgi:hypothetical protein